MLDLLQAKFLVQLVGRWQAPCWVTPQAFCRLAAGVAGAAIAARDDAEKGAAHKSVAMRLAALRELLHDGRELSPDEQEKVVQLN